MQFSVAAILGFAAAGVSASSYSNTTTQSYITEVVTAYTTYCPYATQITHGGNVYNITTATTLTITDCPCTISKPVYTSAVVDCKTCTAATPSAGVPNMPAVPTGPAVTKTAQLPVGTGSATISIPPNQPTAGAGKLAALSGAGLAGLVGFAALL